MRQNRPVNVLNEQAGGALSRTTEGATPFAFFQRVRVLLSATVYLEGKPSVDLILRQEVRCAIEPWARTMSNFTGNPTYQGLRQRECYNFRQALGANLAGRAFRLIDLCENKTEAGLHGNEFGLRSVVA